MPRKRSDTRLSLSLSLSVGGRKDARVRRQVDADEIAGPLLGEPLHQRHGAVCAIGQQGADHPATPEAAQDAVAAQTALLVHAHRTAFISIHLCQ